MAMTSEKKSNGTNIEPPGDPPDLEGYRVKIDCAIPPSAPSAHPQTRRGPSLQPFGAETKQGGGSAAGLCRHHAGRFDQGAGFHQPAEVLFVQMPSRDRFHRAL